MEIEYKWDLASVEGSRNVLDAAEAIVPYVRGSRDISMRATYYDTAEGLVSRLRGGLRLRRENGKGVVCLKLANQGADGCAVRREFEVAADDICTGIGALPQAGAPEDVCAQLLDAELVVMCETLFERRAFSLEADDFAAELAFDEGSLRREGHEREFREMELEHKGGSLDAFHEFAARIEDMLGVERQPLSKLARAMQL